jgi:glycosyltransferase involved in cell wall biosynthesis
MSDRRLAITVVSQCYLPDITGNAAYAHGLAVALRERGHRVTVLASRSSYSCSGEGFAAREVRDGVEVVRLPSGGGHGSLCGRLFASLAFLFHAARRIACGPASDLVIAVTTPPYIGLAARWAARWRGARSAHWVLDCYPDAIAAALGGRSRSLPWRPLLAVLSRLSRVQWRRGDRVLTLGPAIARRLGPYRDATAAWVPLWADARMAPWNAAEPPSLRRERGWQAEPLVLCYSGNLGRGHRWDEFAAAAERLGPAGPLWVFVGSGNRRSQLARWTDAHPTARIAFTPYAPHERLREHLCAADVHLVSMEPGWEGCIVPSKLQNAFAVGRPIIAVVPEQSEPAEWIRASGGGWVVAPGDIDGMVAAVRMAADPVERARRGAAAAVYARRHFSARANLERIARHFVGPARAPRAMAAHP